MISKMQIMESLIGKPIVDSLIQTLYNQSDDFPAIHQTFLDAIEKLHRVLGPEAKRDIQKYVTAIEQMCASNLYHSGVQGLKMNFDHFVNPMMPNCTWQQVDFDDYLRPHIADSLPLYESAYRYKEKFEKQLPEDLQDVIDAVISYESALECSGMKLAHYYGYLMGNELLLHCIPGYHSDMVLDIQYTRMMEQYFGRRLSLDQWEGCYSVKDWKVAPIAEQDAQDTLALREEIWKDAAV